MRTAPLERAGSVTTDAFGLLVADLAPPVFASLDDVGSVAARLVHRIGLHTGADYTGQTFHLSLSPGTVALRVATVHGLDLVDVDEISGADPLERITDSASARVAQLLEETLFELEESKRIIREFSRGARRRMTRTIAELDYSRWSDDGGCLAMVTLTLPGWWQVVAPSGRRFKAVMRAFRARWEREVGPLRGLWKLEFQRRGAPHLHMLLRVPALVAGQTFEQWIAHTWADLCLGSLSERDQLAYIGLGEYDKHLSAHLGEKTKTVVFSGMKFSDPRRTAIYFLKHSSKTMDDKEYQHTVPGIWQEPDAGPGRFWGYWGLDRASVELEVGYGDFVRARRLLRHVARARAAVTDMNRLRSAGNAAAIWTMRRPQARAGFGAKGGGRVLVNDGLALAWDVGRALALP